MTDKQPSPRFPATRLRRTRATAWSRALNRETVLTPADLIWPLFVTDGQGVDEPVASLPGVSRGSVDLIALRAKEAVALGIPCVALFPHTQPGRRSEDGRDVALVFRTRIGEREIHGCDFLHLDDDGLVRGAWLPYSGAAHGRERRGGCHLRDLLVPARGHHQGLRATQRWARWVQPAAVRSLQPHSNYSRRGMGNNIAAVRWPHLPGYQRAAPGRGSAPRCL